MYVTNVMVGSWILTSRPLRFAILAVECEIKASVQLRSSVGESKPSGCCHCVRVGLLNPVAHRSEPCKYFSEPTLKTWQASSVLLLVYIRTDHV